MPIVPFPFDWIAYLLTGLLRIWEIPVFELRTRKKWDKLEAQTYIHTYIQTYVQFKVV